MADKNILHMVTSLKHMSPFDVNMAVDASELKIGVARGSLGELLIDEINSMPAWAGLQKVATADIAAMLAADLIAALDGQAERMEPA